MTVVIAGCGDLGTEAGLRFTATGRSVLALRRSPEHLPAEITGRSIDLTGEVPNLPSDAEIVVIALAPGSRREEAYRSVYGDAVANMIDGVARAGARPRRILLVSSTAVYGVDDGSWVDETTPVEPPSPSAAVIREGEIALHERCTQAISLRLAGLYGPGRTRLIDDVRSGSATSPSVLRHTNRIHRDDAAGAIVHLTTMRGEAQSLYLGADDEPADRGEVLRFLADEMGVPHPVAGEDAPARGRNKRCNNDRLRGTGYRFNYPSYREGYRAVLAGDGRRHR